MISFLFFFSKSFAENIPTSAIYRADTTCTESFDITNFDDFTIIVIKKLTTIKIPKKKEFIAEAFDENGNILYFDNIKSFYQFDFGGKTGKIFIKKLAKHTILTFSVEVFDVNPEFISLLEKNVHLNKDLDIDTYSIFIIVGLIILGTILFLCFRKKRQNAAQQQQQNQEQQNQANPSIPPVYQQPIQQSTINQPLLQPTFNAGYYSSPKKETDGQQMPLYPDEAPQFNQTIYPEDKESINPYADM